MIWFEENVIDHLIASGRDRCISLRNRVRVLIGSHELLVVVTVVVVVVGGVASSLPGRHVL